MWAGWHAGCFIFAKPYRVLPLLEKIDDMNKVAEILNDPDKLEAFALEIFHIEENYKRETKAAYEIIHKAMEVKTRKEREFLEKYNPSAHPNRYGEDSFSVREG